MSKKGGKGKKKGGGDDEEAALKERSEILRTKIEALKFLEQERADKARAADGELRQRILDLEKDFKNEQERKVAIIADMTRQYKQMQSELLTQIHHLNQGIKAREDEKQQKEAELEELEKQGQYKIQEKQNEISELKTRIDNMSSEFAKMLRDTLEKMQSRISMVQWNMDSDQQMVKRIKDIAGLSNN